ncbi:hypothetical protein RIF29_15339 [Crotalaria pallida]|uniref:non-specific serine/threonine protein kinase n=1 Tax=Crotalaria pallida TaxID=3830 RepID=A0AAN9IJ29_CROPI
MNYQTTLFFIPLFFLLIRITLSIDPKFLACHPKTCGNNQNISYPFYIIGKQEQYCGNPGFELTCYDNGFPILNLIDTQYIVQEIFYNNHTLRVTNPVFSQLTTPDQCVAPTQSLNVGKYRFKVGSNQRDMTLFYGCDLTKVPEGLRENRVGCDSENRTSSVVAAFDREDASSLRLACKMDRVVNVTVEDEKGGIREALRKGFVLNWNATNCSACTRSGGKCGFDWNSDTYAFRCYCPDRVHSADCDPG